MVKFSEEWLHELLSKNDIVDVVSEYVTLTKKGARYWACCPFHTEKTPSFSVTPEKQMYYCYSCHKGGDVIKFIMEMEHLGFVEAVTKLAERVGMELPAETENKAYYEKRKYKKRICDLLRDAAVFYNNTLFKEEGTEGRVYLEKRKIQKGIITRFGLGFAPDDFSATMEYLRAKGYTRKELLDAGMVKQKGGRVYDTFRGRVMFPIIDTLGNVIGFGGRVTGEGDPKYLNTSDTLVFNKRKNLFNLNYVRKLKGLKSIVLAEGYMDVISLNAYGVLPVVASLGTALTEDQARLLKKYTEEVFISYDGDAPGIKAALRAIPILEKEGIRVKVILLPDGMDPDDYIKKFGKEKYVQEMKNALPAMRFKLIQKKKEFDTDDPDGLIAYTTAATEMIGELKNKIEQERYIKLLARETGISEETIWRQLGETEEPDRRYNINKNEKNSHKTKIYTNEARMISLLMEEPELIDVCSPIVQQDDFENKCYAEIFSFISEKRKKGILDVNAEILSRYIENENFHPELILEPIDLGMQSKSDYLYRLAITVRRNSMVRKKNELIKACTQTTDESERKRLLEEINKFHKFIYAENER